MRDAVGLLPAAAGLLLLASVGMTQYRANADWDRRAAHAGLGWRSRLVTAFREHRRLMTVQATFLLAALTMYCVYLALMLSGAGQSRKPLRQVHGYDLQAGLDGHQP